MSDTPTSFRTFGAKEAKTPPINGAEVETPAATATIEPNAVSTFVKPVAAALIAFTEQADEKQVIGLFPLVALDKTGSWNPSDYMPKALREQMPVGRKPFPIVVLGYRYELAAFPTGYEQGGNKPKPIWNCAVASSDSENMNAAARLCKNYQFTSKANKSKYDADNSGVGHVKPALAILVYLPELNQLVELRSRPCYQGSDKTGREIAAHITQDGTLEPFPCEVAIETTVVETPANKWDVYHLLFRSMTSDKLNNVKAAFQTWAAAAGQDSETVSKYNEWMAAADKPVTPDIAALIAKGSRL